jgi:hypothetical protein
VSEGMGHTCSALGVVDQIEDNVHLIEYS